MKQLSKWLVLWHFLNWKTTNDWQQIRVSEWVHVAQGKHSCVHSFNPNPKSNTPKLILLDFGQASACLTHTLAHVFTYSYIDKSFIQELMEEIHHFFLKAEKETFTWSVWIWDLNKTHLLKEATVEVAAGIKTSKAEVEGNKVCLHWKPNLWVVTFVVPPFTYLETCTAPAAHHCDPCNRHRHHRHIVWECILHWSNGTVFPRSSVAVFGLQRNRRIQKKKEMHIN